MIALFAMRKNTNNIIYVISGEGKWPVGNNDENQVNVIKSLSSDGMDNTMEATRTKTQNSTLLFSYHPPASAGRPHQR